MAKQCETFDHTADVGLLARADTPAELFEALAEGLADYICPRDTVRPREIRTLSVEAEDIEALAVDFLAAVLNVIQADRFMVAAVRVVECGGVNCPGIDPLSLEGRGWPEGPGEGDASRTESPSPCPLPSREREAHSKVTAELSGEPFDPARHEIHTEVKAVTYHLLKVAQEGGLWTGRIVLDL